MVRAYGLAALVALFFLSAAPAQVQAQMADGSVKFLKYSSSVGLTLVKGARHRGELLFFGWQREDCQGTRQSLRRVEAMSSSILRKSRFGGRVHSFGPSAGATSSRGRDAHGPCPVVSK